MPTFGDEEYNHTEQLQDILRTTLNREVNEWFQDIPGSVDDDGNPAFDFKVPRGALKMAAIHMDKDSIDMTILRILVFFLVVGGMEKYSSQVFGIPVPEYQETRKFKPQITLYFAEDLEDVETGYDPVTMEVSFRLMDETSSSLTIPGLTAIANKIKMEFGVSNGYRFHKGRLMCSYVDKEKGFQFQLNSFAKSDARNLVQKILNLRNEPPDWKNFNVNENEEPAEKFPAISMTQTILGKSYRKPRRRPVAYVRFLCATCAVWGLPKPVVLYDRSGRWRNPLVSS